MPRTPVRLIHIGIKRHVIALDRSTGAEVWRTKLEGLRVRSSDFVYLLVDDDRLHATVSGELFCLDSATGTVIWHNQLTGLGTGFVSIAGGSARPGDGGPSSLFASAARDRAARGQAAT